MQPISPIAAVAPRAAPAVHPATPGDAAPSPAATGPNPRLRVDPALNMVVVEFRGADGGVARTLPTEQELRDYRAAQRRGEAPQASSVMPRPSAAALQPESAPAAASSSALPAR